MTTVREVLDTLSPRVVSLATRHDRRAAITRRLAAGGFRPPVFIDARTPEQMGGDRVRRLIAGREPLEPGRYQSEGKRGPFFAALMAAVADGHAEAIRDALRSDDPYVWILEDDAALKRAEVLSVPMPGRPMALLGALPNINRARWRERFARASRYSTEPVWYPVPRGRISGSHAYLLRRDGAEVLLRDLESGIGEVEILWQRYPDTAVILAPPPFVQDRNLPSDAYGTPRRRTTNVDLYESID